MLSDGTTVFVPLGDAIDLAQERARLAKETERLNGLVAGQEKKLGNEQFVARAPAEIVDKEREKLASWRQQAQALEAKLAQLGAA